MVGSYELKFDDPSAKPLVNPGSGGGETGPLRTVYLTKRQIILNSPDGEALTLIAVNEIPAGLSTHKPNFFRKLFIVPKYFAVKYIIMMNGKRYKVISAY
jgi:hypothetical protein